eukprot:2969276-Prymnesium_polylepis.2
MQTRNLRNRSPLAPQRCVGSSAESASSWTMARKERREAKEEGEAAVAAAKSEGEAAVEAA